MGQHQHAGARMRNLNANTAEKKKYATASTETAVQEVKEHHNNATILMVLADSVVESLALW